MTGTIQGGCLCGAVRYEVRGAFGRTGHCHCSICRRFHGAAFVTWTFVSPEQFHWVKGADCVRAYKSSANHERLSCEHCGSRLAAGSPGQVFEVVLASVDGDPGVRPAEHIFVDSRAPWHEITDDLKQWSALPADMQA